MLHTATTNHTVLVAADAVARAATPRRNQTLRDEFGPIRGRRMLSGDLSIEPIDTEVDELGRSHYRAQLAWAIAG
jgi:hypothetical protein